MSELPPGGSGPTLGEIGDSSSVGWIPKSTEAESRSSSERPTISDAGIASVQLVDGDRLSEQHPVEPDDVLVS